MKGYRTFISTAFFLIFFIHIQYHLQPIYLKTVHFAIAILFLRFWPAWANSEHLWKAWLNIKYTQFTNLSARTRLKDAGDNDREDEYVHNNANFNLTITSNYLCKSEFHSNFNFSSNLRLFIDDLAKVHPSHSIFLPLHFSVSIYFISSADRRCRNNRKKSFSKFVPCLEINQLNVWLFSRIVYFLFQQQIQLFISDSQ